jgi:predicted phosphodiesterase
MHLLEAITMTPRQKDVLEAWQRLGSPTLVSAELKITPRAVLNHRRTLESLGHELPLTNDQSARRLNVLINESRQFIDYEITDGCIVIGSDAHYSPSVVPVAHKAMLKVIKFIKPQAVILNGDIFDGGSISKHSPIGWQKTHNVKDELEAVQERLAEIEKVAKSAYLMRTWGNHCIRFESRLSGMVPEYRDVAGTRLKDHIPLWQDAWRIKINTNVIVLHDWHQGIHSGWNDVLKSGGYSVITGHTHELSYKTHRGFGQAHYGIKTGMLADEDQSEFAYRGGKPGMMWTSGFVILTFRDGRLLPPEMATVDDGVCYFRGQPV